MKLSGSKRFINPINYYYLFKNLIKSLKVFKLLYLPFRDTDIKLIWRISSRINIPSISKSPYLYYIFGTPIDCRSIKWHTDPGSNFTYPLLRIDKLKINKFYNKGIDVKFPWEIARFQFSITLAQYYRTTQDIHYYNVFKQAVKDFLSNNPFLYGINWLSPMEASIRAINWILTINLFGEVFRNDKDFNKVISRSLEQHGEYIYSFLEIYYKGHTTNHTISNFCGLLFLSLTIPGYNKSNLWLDKATKGLENCISDQVLNDGIHFESSIPYHRFVLEMFTYTSIAGLANGVEFSTAYYIKLFKMFEYTAAYLDKSGNAPQIGDNDSGKLLRLNGYNYNSYASDCNHSYLLSLGKYIFNYDFKSQCTGTKDEIISFLPEINSLDMCNLKITPRNTDESIDFINGGAYFLKNSIFSLLVSCFPMGQHGKGGHNHLDAGSFTLSINGEQSVVDPGTYTYTRSKILRDIYRSYDYHNTLYTEDNNLINWDDNSYWDLKPYYKCEVIDFMQNTIKIKASSTFVDKFFERTFYLKDDHVGVINNYEGRFFLRINLHPDIIIHSFKNSILKTNKFLLQIENNTDHYITDYNYAPIYNKQISSKCLVITGTQSVKMKFIAS